MPNSLKSGADKALVEARPSSKVKFKILGEEMIDKKLSPGGCSSGTIYLPPDWVDRRAEIIRVD